MASHYHGLKFDVVFLPRRVKEVLPPPKSECVSSTQPSALAKLETASGRVLASVAVCAEEPDVRTRKIVKVVTQTMVDGKVVDESSEVEQIEETRK